jgi:hypothetical protein
VCSAILRIGFLIALPVVFSGAASAAPAQAHGRPLISAPSQLINKAQSPCVMYLCAAHPTPNQTWENELLQLPTDYCMLYGCLPMDLVPDHGFDDNLFPLNPDWGYQLTNGTPPDPLQLCGGLLHGPFYLGSPGCSNEATNLDRPGSHTLAAFFCPRGRKPRASIHGHINWEPATYTGSLRWDTHSTPGTDDEYSLDLATPGGAGTTVNNAAGNIHIEFDSDETIDAFDDNAWWRGFHQDVHLDDVYHTHEASNYVDGDFAIVTGLIGLDTAHSPAAESHPVWIIAIQTTRQLALRGGIDRWAFFVRNWGDEGYCSDQTHRIPTGPLTIRFPWLTKGRGIGPLQSASGVTLAGYDVHDQGLPNGQDFATYSVLPQRGVLLEFNFPPVPPLPGLTSPMYWGTVDLRWTFRGNVEKQPDSSPAAAQLGHEAAIAGAEPTSAADGGESSDVEALVAQLWGRLPVALRSRLLASLPHLQANPHAIHRLKLTITRPPIAPARSVGFVVAPKPDPEMLALGRVEYRDVCAAYHDRVPPIRLPDSDILRLPCPSWTR